MFKSYVILWTESNVFGEDLTTFGKVWASWFKIVFAWGCAAKLMLFLTMASKAESKFFSCELLKSWLSKEWAIRTSFSCQLSVVS